MPDIYDPDQKLTYDERRFNKIIKFGALYGRDKVDAPSEEEAREALAAMRKQYQELYDDADW